MKIKWLKKERLAHPIEMIPGDTLSCKYTKDYFDEKTGVILKTETHNLADATATEKVSIDEVRIFEFKNWADLRKGIGGLFGERKKLVKK